MTEDDLLRCCLDLARLYGWRTFHARPAMTAKGYRTPVQGDGRGWPDLLMVRASTVIAAELKSDKGSLTAEQSLWLETLNAAFINTYVWRPADWHSGEILRVLSGSGAAQPRKQSAIRRAPLDTVCLACGHLRVDHKSVEPVCSECDCACLVVFQ